MLCQVMLGYATLRCATLRLRPTPEAFHTVFRKPFIMRGNASGRRLKPEAFHTCYHMLFPSQADARSRRSHCSRPCRCRPGSRWEPPWDICIYSIYMIQYTILQYHIMSCYTILYYIISYYIMILYQIISYYITLHYIISYYITLYYIITEYSIVYSIIA